MEVKFVSYDGKYPNLCNGNLVVEIDRKRVSFGWTKDNKYWTGETADFHKFWSTGGRCCFSQDGTVEIKHEPWTMECANKKDYPQEVWLALPRVLEVMNENVPYGCCGGCL